MSKSSNFLAKFAKKRKKMYEQYERTKALKKAIPDTEVLNVDGSFIDYNMGTPSHLSDESDLSTMSELDTNSTRFVNMMSVINNPSLNTEAAFLSAFKKFFKDMNTEYKQKKRKKKKDRLMRMTRKVARSISAETFKGYKVKVTRVILNFLRY